MGQIPCTSKYIGESRRRLHVRILEHNHLKESAICNHINSCTSYKKQLNDYCNDINNNDQSQIEVLPTPIQKRNFIKQCFRPIAQNSNYYQRTRLEGVAIRLNEPDLNEQIIHKKISII